MNEIDKRKVSALIHKIGLDYNMSDQQIKAIVDSPFLFTYLKIRELDLTEIDDIETLRETKTNFLYKALGKIFISEPLFKRRQKQKLTGINLNLNKWKNKH